MLSNPYEDVFEIPKNQSIYKAIQEISIYSYTSILAYWVNKLMPPVIFRPIFTEEGLCITFNSINSNEIYSNE